MGKIPVYGTDPRRSSSSSTPPTRAANRGASTHGRKLRDLQQANGESVGRGGASKGRAALWGKGKGAFRSQARYAAATVRGTFWLTADRCDGTQVTVRQGRVEVSDLVLHKKQSWFAPAGADLARKR